MSAVEQRSPPLLESEPEPECAGHVVKSGSEERGSRERERERETERQKEGETEERCVREDLKQAAARFRLLFSLSLSRSLSPLSLFSLSGTLAVILLPLCTAELPWI